MKDSEREISSVTDDEVEFKIKNSAKAFSILSSNLYSDPIRAIIRELCCNAIDANRDKGVTTPISISFPDSKSNIFSVEDQGIGMTEEEVYNLYTTYFSSSKEDRNDQIGALGLGSKSPFSYTDSFNIISCKNGIKGTYLAYINDRSLPVCTKVHTTSCDISKTGTLVSFPVKEKDYKKFYTSAISAMLPLEVLPNIINGKKEFYEDARDSHYIRLDDNKILEINKMLNTSSFIPNIYNFKRDSVEYNLYADSHFSRLVSFGSSGNTQVNINMGGVLYYVNINEFLENIKEPDKSFLEDYLTSGNKILRIKANIGDVDISPNRESLYYNKRTIDFLVSSIYNELITSITAEVSNEDKSDIYSKYINKDKFTNILMDPKSILARQIDPKVLSSIKYYKNLVTTCNISDNFLLGITELGGYNKDSTKRMEIYPSTRIEIKDKAYMRISDVFSSVYKFLEMNEKDYDYFRGKVDCNKPNEHTKIIRLDPDKVSAFKKLGNQNTYCSCHFIIYKAGTESNIQLATEFMNDNNKIKFEDIIVKKERKKRETKSLNTEKVTILTANKFSAIGDKSIEDLLSVGADNLVYIINSASNYYVYNGDPNFKLKDLTKINTADLTWADSLRKLLYKEYATNMDSNIIVSIPVSLFKDEKIYEDSEFTNLTNFISDNLTKSIDSIKLKIDNMNLIVDSRYTTSNSRDRYYREVIDDLSARYKNPEKSEYYKFFTGFKNNEAGYNTLKKELNDLSYATNKIESLRSITSNDISVKIDNLRNMINSFGIVDESKPDRYPMIKAMYYMYEEMVGIVSDYIALVDKLDPI
jgi:hypothetical protein